MAWIESHDTLGEHPKLKKLALLLNISRPQAVGHLHYLWWWGLKFADYDGGLGKYDETDIAAAANWEGDPLMFVQALLDCGKPKRKGFLERTETGELIIHDWDDYEGRLMDQRKLAAERARKSRERRKQRLQALPDACDTTIPDQTEPDITQPDTTAKSPGGASLCLGASLIAKRESAVDNTTRLSVASRQSDSGGVSPSPPTKEPSKPRRAPPRASSDIVPAHGASVDKPSEEEQADWRALIDSIQQDFPAYAFGLPAVVLQSLHEWHPRLDSACILRAIGEAVRNGAVSKDGLPKWNYVEKVCLNWIALGVRRVEDITPLEQDRAYRRERDKQSKGRYSQDTGDGPDVVSTVVRHPKPERRTK